jgi:hypothetical protein
MISIQRHTQQFGRPSFLFGHRWRVLIGLSRPALFVVQCSAGFVPRGLFFTCRTGVLCVVNDAVGPAIRFSLGDSTLICGVVTRRAAGGGEGEILVGLLEMFFEICQSFIGFIFITPVARSKIKESGFFDDLVADASDNTFVHDLARRDDKLIAFFKLLEELLDRRWWMPGGFHAFVVGDEIRSLNFTKSFPEMRKDFEGRDFVKASCRMTERFDVFDGNGFKELIAKRFNGVVIEVKQLLSFVVLAVRFDNLRGCGVGSVNWVERRLHRRNAWNAVGHFEVLGFGNYEKKVTVLAISKSGGKGLRIVVDFILKLMERQVIGFGCRGSNRGEFAVRKRVNEVFGSRLGGHDDESDRIFRMWFCWPCRLDWNLFGRQQRRGRDVVVCDR